MLFPRLVWTTLSLGMAISLCAVPSIAQFETRSSLNIATAPFALAAGDFNGDGKLDLAATSYIPVNGVTILLGNGDGTFRVGASYAVGAALYFPTAVDLRNNGITDLVVGDQNSDNIYVMLGNGEGTFQAAVPYPTTGGAYSLKLGDFNGDGKPDIVVVTSSEQCLCISVFLGNGDGTLKPPINTPVPYGILGLGLAPGHFDTDDKLDLAVVGFFAGIEQVDILLGNGDGTFTPRSFYPVAGEPESVVAADFNGDGMADLAVADLTGFSVSVLLGKGNGTFRQAVDYYVYGPPALAAADLDGDGIIDIAASAGFDPAGVSVFKGNGDGTFKPQVFYPGGTESEYVVVGDFNGDGKPDLVSAAYVDEEVITLLNTGVVSFSPTTPITPPTTLLGSTSAARSVTLTNNGTSPLTISSMKASGPPFRMRTTCEGSVAPGGSCDIAATFTAQVEGVTTGTVTIRDSASSKPQVVELIGTGTGVKLEPTRLIFGQQKVHTQSQPQTATLTNLGTGVLNISSISLVGVDGLDYPETNNCPAALDSGASCTISVTFKPSKTGTRKADVSCVDDGGGTQQYLMVSGIGTN